MTTRGLAIDLSTRTQDAYSVDRYASWVACAALLLRRGYSEREAEAILRSKWMRWASDGSGAPYGKATSGDLARFLDNPKNRCTKAEVAELVRGTF